MQRLCLSCQYMKHNAWKTPGKSINNGRYEAGGQIGVASDPNFPSGWIGERLNVLHRLAQIIEYGCSTVQQGATELGRLYAERVAIEQTDTDGTLQFGDRS